jgi:putative two-component system response regulator
MDIAIIDDSRSVLLELNSAISSFRGVVTHLFTDPIEALARCDDTYFDLVLVDFVMPGLNGIEVVRKLRGKAHYRNIPIVMVTSERDREVKIQAIEAGATDFLGKPFDTVELKARVGNLLDLRAAQLGLERKALKLEATVETVMRDVAAKEEEIIWRLARAVEYRDGNTGSHVSRVAEIARLIAVDLGFDERRAHMLYLAAPLHDIGKIGVADSVLLKPGRLTPEEIIEMRRHVEIGVKILENAPRGSSRWRAGSQVAITRSGMAPAIPRGWPERTFRSRRGSSRSPMSSKRSAPNGPTRPPGRSRTPVGRSSRAAARISTRLALQPSSVAGRKSGS